MAGEMISATVERRIESPGVIAELQNRDHAPYVDTTFTEGLHTLALFQARHSEPALARFRCSGAEPSFRQIGQIVTMPANVPLEVRGPGGRIRATRCRFTPGVLREISGRDHFGSRDELAACLNVRGPTVRLLLESLARELEHPGFASVTYVEAIGHALIIEMARYLQHTPRPARTGAGLSAQQMATLTDYLHAVQHAPAVAEVGALLGYSPRHVNRIFRRSTGQTLHGYIEDIRFARACRLLEQGDMLIKEIAYQLGFSCASNFAVAFRRCAGMSPQDYARRHGRRSVTAH